MSVCMTVYVNIIIIINCYVDYGLVHIVTWGMDFNFQLHLVIMDHD